MAELTICCPKLSRFLRDSRKAVLTTAMILQAANDIVGGFLLASTFQNPKITDVPPDRHGIPMPFLADRLKEMGFPVFSTDRGYFQRQVEPVTETPASDPPEVAGLRSDTVTLCSRFPSLVRTFRKGEITRFPVWESSEIRAGFFCFPLAQVPGQPQNLDSFCTRVVHSITGAGEDVVYLLGTARGTVNQYIDVLIFDYPFLIAFATQFFRTTALTEVFFQPFDQKSPPIPLRLNQAEAPSGTAEKSRKRSTKKKGKRRR